jgi:hypothetical protein
MSNQLNFRVRTFRRAAVVALTLVALLATEVVAQNININGGGGRGRNGNRGGGGGFGGGGLGNGGVGGISVDAKGMLRNAGTTIDKKIVENWRKALQPQDGDLVKKAPMRKVSLRGLQAAIEKHFAENGKDQELPEEILYLGGLQRVQYVFLYPDKRDIVLAGPAEGWKINKQGTVVGITTGEPVLNLDDLIVALRVGKESEDLISVSIDPTAEGVARFQKFVNSLRGVQQNPAATARMMESAIGLQEVSYTGVPNESRMAQVLVAADYRMKRFAMNLDKSPVRALPSYLKMASTAGPAMPRWWLTANYEALAKDAQGLAWKLSSASVKCETEDSIFGADGKSRSTGKSSKAAQAWADKMTKNYDELAAKDKTFAELRNTMDLALVGALIAEEGLAEKAKCNLDVLMDNKRMPTLAYYVPKTISAQASLVKKSRGWLVSVSGGVTLDPWKATKKTTTDASLPSAREKVEYTTNNWWWN